MRIKFALAAAVAAASLGVSAEAKTLKASTAAPANTPWVSHLEKSAEALSAATGGAMTMEVFPSNQLGAETETIKQTARGRLDVGVFSVTAVATVVPEITMLVTPFFWDSFEQAECAIDNHLSDTFNALFEKRGLHLVQWQELGWQNLFTNEVVSEPSEVANLKMRVAPAKNNDIYWRAAGVSGVPLPFAEIASTLQTGVIEGGELPSISYVAAGIGKLSPHLVKTRHIYQPSVMLISKKVWDKMSPEEQTAFSDSMESADALRAAVRGAINFFEAKHVENGGTIADLDDEARAKWAALFTEEHQQELIGSIGGEAQRIFDAQVAARAACTK